MQFAVTRFALALCNESDAASGIPCECNNLIQDKLLAQVIELNHRIKEL